MGMFLCGCVVGWLLQHSLYDRAGCTRYSLGFPKQAPICYVHPTPNMIIKPGHRLVDGSGLVRAPYNDHWAHPRANLSDLATSLSEAGAWSDVWSVS
jgi:hypothetical protein